MDTILMIIVFPSGEENFPVGEYSDPAMVAILREIGLRGLHDVEPEDLMETAQQIQDALAEVKPTIVSPYHPI